MCHEAYADSLKLGCLLRTPPSTVGFHNFNLRNFNLRVSNPNKLIVDVFLTRCRISMCQGLGPKNTEISEIDRTVIQYTIMSTNSLICYTLAYLNIALV